MHRLKEFTMIGLNSFNDVYLYTVLEEKRNPDRFVLRTKHMKTAGCLDLTEQEDEFIERLEQTGICNLNNREYDYITEDCGIWFVRICYDDKDIVIGGWDHIPEEVRAVLKMIGIELYYGPSKWERSNYHEMTDSERLYRIGTPMELAMLNNAYKHGTMMFK